MNIDEQYEVLITEACRIEIKKIYEYIKNDLYAENSAKKLMNKIEKVVMNLTYEPRIYAEIGIYKNIKRSYRRVVVDNFVLLYTIDEEAKKIYISHMYYGGCDYINKC